MEEDAVEVGGKGGEEAVQVSAVEVKAGLPQGRLGSDRGKYVGRRLGKNNRFKFDQISLIPAIVFIPSLDEVL